MKLYSLHEYQTHVDKLMFASDKNGSTTDKILLHYCTTEQVFDDNVILRESQSKN